MYYGNVVIGWSEEGFQKAEEDKTTKKVVNIDPGQSQFPSASADASYNIVGLKAPQDIAVLDL